MTRYEWTPASEPPDSAREVLLGLQYADGDQRFVVGKFHKKAEPKYQWVFRGCRTQRVYVTHWRDVAPPDVPEIGFGNMAGGD